MIKTLRKSIKSISHKENSALTYFEFCIIIKHIIMSEYWVENNAFLQTM